MNLAAPVKAHPNATLALASSPVAILVVWILTSVLKLQMPAEVSTGLGAWIAGLSLVFAGSIKKAAAAVWEIGVAGVFRRIWHGAGGS